MIHKKTGMPLISGPMLKLNDFSKCYEGFTIETLKDYLKKYQLEPRFNGQHITHHGCCDSLEFFGNFVDVSYVFNFSLRDGKECQELINLIDANLSKEWSNS
ncbi:MAG: hypothetical protein ABFD07_07870 [Methanobacterium sp.]